MVTLHKAIRKIIADFSHPVGEYFETDNLSFDPNQEWAGQWNLENDGTVLVSKSNTNGSKFNTAIGSIVGEETHLLTIEELPRNVPEYHSEYDGNFNADYNADIGNFAIDRRTSDLPHNNVQPSKIINRWHRVA